MRLSLLASRTGLFALCLLLLTGCDPIIRTYGSHGNVEAHHAQMALLVENFEASLARNRADLARLSQNATPAAARAAEQMAELVKAHEAIAAGHRARYEELQDNHDYRDLNRAYGAMITEQQMVADRYNDIVTGLQSGREAFSYPASVVEKARYVVVPPQYYRVNNVLRAGGLGTLSAAPTAGEAAVAADTTGTAPADTAAVAPAAGAPLEADSLQ